METRLTVKNIRYQSWFTMVQQQIKSGLPVRQWCAQNSISTKTFYFRRKRVREELLQTAAPTFAEVTAPASAAEGPALADPEGFIPCLTISVNGLVIGVGRGTSGEFLTEVLKVVRNA